MDEETNDSEKWTFQPNETPETTPTRTGKKDSKLLQYALIAVVFFVGGFLISNMTGITGQVVGTERISVQEVNEKISNYVTENLLQASSEFEIIDTTEENGIYVITMSIDEQEFISYASLDGKFLFPSGFDMEEVIEELEMPVPTTEPEIPKTEEPVVELFVMSFCPYGMQAENTMLPVVELLGDSVDIILQYIVSLNDDGSIRSLHGEYEANENARQLCIMEEYSVIKLWEYLEIFNPECNRNNLDTCWKEKAEEAGIDVAVIEQCFEEKGTELLETQAIFSGAKGVTGSPTLLINGVKYTGSRTTDGFKEAICSAFITPPEECSEILSLGDDSTQNNAPSGNC